MDKRKRTKFVLAITLIMIAMTVVSLLAGSKVHVVQTLYSPTNTVTDYGYFGFTTRTENDATPNPNLVNEVQEIMEAAGINLLLTGATPRKDWIVKRFVSGNEESVTLLFEITATQDEVFDHYKRQFGETEIISTIPHTIDETEHQWTVNGNSVRVSSVSTSITKTEQRVAIYLRREYPLTKVSAKLDSQTN